MDMKRRATVLAAAAVAAVGMVTGPPLAAQADDHASRGHDRPSASSIARQVLPAGDGWASATTGTTGGAAAPRTSVLTVRTREQLAQAVAGDKPKIVFVSGRIDANTDATGRRLTCQDYARDGYTLERYLQAYDPEVWGREEEPSGPVEDARRASQQAQAERVTIRIGANTTLIGRPGAEITGANLRVDRTSNVILRGLTVTDAYDCFPAWDPTDGETGNWNSEYDTLSLTGASHVWIDHNEFSDADNLDSTQPTYFGRPYQVHDGLIDITNASDLVTVSYNRLHDHDKTMLIGSSDSRITDRGKLRVTVHHNEFRDLGQRVPRVRFGQVDVYNNHYIERQDAPVEYVYSWGIGVESHLVAERNALTLPRSVGPERIIEVFKGTSLTENDNLVNGEPVDIVAAYNAASEPNLTEVPAWTPLLRRTVHPAVAVPRVVSALAGPRSLGARERIVVDRRGSGDSRTVQGAVDQSPTGSVDRVDIVIKPGRYRERVVVDAQHTQLAFRGATGSARDVVITYDNASGTPKPGGGTWGTTGSASVTLAGADFQATAITFENAFDEAAHPEMTSRQAVAVKTLADRIVFDRCRFLGNQDTLYLDSPSVNVPARVYVQRSWVEGDVDFIFGRATAVIDKSIIKSLARAATPSGYVTAPSTSANNPYGFLITRSRLISNAERHSVFLGRPWHPSSAPNNDPQIVIRQSWLGQHVITADPWTTMSGYDWNSGRYAEYRNRGPGATGNANRPQLTRQQARQYQVSDYLAGNDGWAPHRNRSN
jgi:pectate lyase